MSEEINQPDTEQPAPGTAITNFIDGLGKAFETLGAALAQALEQIIPVMQQVYASLEARYQEDGAPYGNSHEGLMRWLNDMGEISRKQQEIEHIRMRHEMLVDARKLGEKWRARAIESSAEPASETGPTRGSA